MKEILAYILFTVSVFLLGVSITMFVIDYNDKITSFTKQEIGNYSECANLNLEDTANCLRDYVGTFYNYNLSNVREDLTFEELESEGGVCWHYANLYKEYADKLGFYGDTKTISLNETLSHRFATISNEDAYCILDQAVPLAVEEYLVEL